MSVDEDSKWYYLQEGKSVGPFSKAQLIQLLVSDKINEEVLIWSPDKSEEWKSLRDTIDLKEELPPPLPSQNIQSLEGNIPSDSSSKLKYWQVDSHPWRRFFARVIDNTTNGIVMWFAILILLLPIAPTFSNQFFIWTTDTETGLAKYFSKSLLTILAIFINAAFIGFTGSSLGKWLFGIRVTDKHGRVIGYAPALKRELLIWYRGLGCGVPYISPITTLYQMKNLQRNKITSWDKEMALHVSYRKRSRLEWLLSIVSVIILILMAASP